MVLLIPSPVVSPKSFSSERKIDLGLVFG